MVCHIELFTAGAFLPVLGFVIFPCFIVNIVRMNRQRLCLRIFADGAGAFSGTCFGCGGLLCYRPIIESMVAHFSFLAAAAFLPVLGFIFLPIAVAVLMFKHRNGFGLHIVADRAVTCFGAFFGLGGRLRHSPFAVGMVCHIQLFTTGTLLPVINIIIFPCFVMDAVFMNRNRLCLRIFADGAGAFSGTCFGCGGLLCYRPIIESMVAHFSFLAAAAFLPVLGFIFLPIAVAVLMFKHRNGFGLHIVADRAVTCFGAFFGLGGRLRHSPFAVGMVCHIQLFTTGTLLPVISIIIFPCFIVNIVRMDRNRLFLRIFADGAGAFF